MDACAPLTAVVEHEDPALEELTRRLLALLGRVTGLESTYPSR